MYAGSESDGGGTVAVEGGVVEGWYSLFVDWPVLRFGRGGEAAARSGVAGLGVGPACW